MTPVRKFIVFLTLSGACHLHAQYKTDDHSRFDFKTRDKSGPVVIQNNTPETPTPSYKPPPIPFTPISRPTPPRITHDIAFRFTDIGLQKVGQDFIISHDIISLSLDNNNITEISPFAFRKMRNLHHLNLSGNRIPMNRLLMLVGNVKLQSLFIDNNQPVEDWSHNPKSRVLKNFEILESLQYLHLRSSQLGNFEIPFSQATPMLTHLHLSNNSIESSDVVFDNIPPSLTHLCLDNNKLDRVNEEKLRYLQELVMDNNVIEKVCFDCTGSRISLKGALRMQNLSLSNNHISEVTDNAFIDTRHLINLDLSGNSIADLAKNTFNHTIHVTTLSLADNQLVVVPEVCSMVYLKSLNLTGNRISVIHTVSFCNLRNLEYLYLSNNVISTVESRAFMNLQALKYLDLSGNRLTHLPQQWAPSWSLQNLHIERNMFRTLDDLTLINIKSLRNVYIDGNLIRYIKAESFHPLLAHLTLHMNIMQTWNKCDNCKCNDNDTDDDLEDDNGDDDF